METVCSIAIGICTLLSKKTNYTWISKPFPIRITLIRITFNGMTSYFNHESRLPI